MRLDLSRINVTDASVPALRSFKKLQHLDVNFAPITPDSLAPLLHSVPTVWWQS
jgi:hypothetical protein